MNFIVPNLTPQFYAAASPILILCVGALVSLTFASFPRLNRERLIVVVHVGSLIAALCASLLCVTYGRFLNNSFIMDSIAALGTASILLIAIVCSLLFWTPNIRSQFFRGDVSAIFLTMVIGMLTMLSAGELVTLFVGLEIASISLYGLVGYIFPTRLSVEGAVKYFVLGSVASAIFLFGIALLFASSGSMDLNLVIERLNQDSSLQLITALGLLLLLVGLAFKLALAPFHMWAPDAYEAAPTALTAFMATAFKVMIVVVVIRISGVATGHLGQVWSNFFIGVCAISMIVGNVMALVQASLKRLLAYSSIAHIGYMSLGLGAISGAGIELAGSATLYYLISYCVISLMAFSVIVFLEKTEGSQLLLKDLKGMGSRNPFAAFTLALSMFALSGIPPTAGFVSKFFVFNAAILAGHIGLVILAVVGTVIGVFYYLRVIVTMYMEEEKVGSRNFSESSFGYPRKTYLASLMVLTLLLGTVLPQVVQQYCRAIISGSKPTLVNK